MLGDNIKRLREQKGLDLKDLAKAANVSVAYISLIENNQRQNPSTKVLSKIAEALEVSIDDFFKEKNEKLKKLDNEYSPNGELTEQIKFIESLNLGTPEEALKFILQQPNFMAYGGYNLDDLSEEEIMDLANDMLLAMKISIEKKKRK